MNNKWKTFLSEFSAALIFTISYFVIAGRANVERFDYSYLHIAMFSAMFYVFVIFISSYHYKTDIFPAFSLMRCMLEKKLEPLLLNIPAQLIGAVVGFFIYVQLQSTVLEISPMANNENITNFGIQDVFLRSFTFVLLIYILSYLMVLIRYSFRLKGLTGTLLISVVVFVISAITLPIEGVSVITLWQDILLSLFHYRAQLGELLHLSIKPFLISVPLILIGAVLAYFKLADLMENAIIHLDKKESEKEISEQFDSNFDI